MAVIRKSILLILALCLLLGSVSAARTVVPIEDLKTYELIELWDTIPFDKLSPSENLVRSFRDVSSEYTREQAFISTAAYNDVAFLHKYNDLSEPAQDLTEQTFHALPVEARVWSVQFTNKKYPAYVVHRGRIDIESGSEEITERPAYTVVRLPFTEQYVSITKGSAQMFIHDGQTTLVFSGAQVNASLLIEKEISKDEIDVMTVASYWISEPPTVQVVVPEPELQTPIIITSTQPEQKLPLLTMVVGVVLVACLAGGGIWYHRHKNMQDLVAKYSAPQDHTNVTPTSEEKHTSVLAHLQDVLHIFRK